jgi:hypothetical protein
MFPGMGPEQKVNPLGIQIEDELTTGIIPPSIKREYRLHSIVFMVCCIYQCANELPGKDRDKFLDIAIASMRHLGITMDELDWALEHGPFKNQDDDED